VDVALVLVVMSWEKTKFAPTTAEQRGITDDLDNLHFNPFVLQVNHIGRRETVGRDYKINADGNS